MAFPSSIISFSTKSNGQVIDAQDIDIPQTEITALETKVGVDNSSVVGSIDYKIGTSGDGGGHVQPVKYGGTGQTSYSKGDILVASSSSVLGKVAIGGDGLSLLADSSQTNGVSWGQVTANLPYAQDSGSGSVYAISPVPCILSYVPGQIYVAKITNANTVVAPALSVSSLIARKVVNVDGTALTVGQIPSSSLSMFGYDGSASVMQLINPVALKNFGTFTAATIDGVAHTVSTNCFIFGYFNCASNSGTACTAFSSSGGSLTILGSNTNSTAWDIPFTLAVKKGDSYTLALGTNCGGSATIVPLI